MQVSELQPADGEQAGEHTEMAELILPDVHELEPRRTRIDHDMRREDDWDGEHVRLVWREAPEQGDRERERRRVGQAVVGEHLEALALLHRHPRALEGEVADEVQRDEHQSEIVKGQGRHGTPPLGFMPKMSVHLHHSTQTCPAQSRRRIFRQHL